MLLLRLYWEFFKVGLFAVGGGLATVPFLYDMGEKTGWFTASTVADMIAVSESTPGPIGVNMATYTGYSTAGILGGICATLGLVTPCIIVILLIALFLKSFQDNRYVTAAFTGLRPASTGLIAASGLSIAVMCFIDTAAFSTRDILRAVRLPQLILAAAVLVFTRWVKPTKKLHPIIFIAASAVIGIVFRMGGA